MGTRRAKRARGGPRANPRQRARAVTGPREREWGPTSFAGGARGAAPRNDDAREALARPPER